MKEKLQEIVTRIVEAAKERQPEDLHNVTEPGDVPHTPTLRRRKPGKKHASLPIDHIGESEILLTSLPANSCRIINCKLRQSLVGRGNGYSDIRSFVAASDGFHVKSGNIGQYAGELNIQNIDVSPSSMCPWPEVHVDMLTTHGHELPLACPTCWSIQRNR